MNEPKVSIYKADPSNEMGDAYIGRIYVWLPAQKAGPHNSRPEGYSLLPFYLGGPDPDEIRRALVERWETDLAKEKALVESRKRTAERRWGKQADA